MRFYADLHIHSKYSRATSRNCDLEHLAMWARRKGIAVIATGDFTHPAWFDEIRDKLVPAEPGLFRLRPEIEREIDRRVPRSCPGPTRFMLEVEISTIYKKGEKTRKVHHLVYAPDIDTASRFRDALGKIGNIASDGRPILGLDSRHLLEIALDSGPGAYLVPAHIWTPWFAALGSKSGFDSIEECYGDLAEHIFAVETGLSSDPPMNWRVSRLDRFSLVSNSDAHSPPMLGREANVFDTELDYFAMRRALETGDGFGGTVEFFPEEGKYHLDGHRSCKVRLEPRETRERDGSCPVCGKPVTIGVMHRVEMLADRSTPRRPEKAAPYRSLVPLPEVVSEICGVGPKSKTVERQVAMLVSRLGPELPILESLPIEDLGRAGNPLVAEAIERLRAGRVRCAGGYDGEYGTIRIFDPGELAARTAVASLFGPPEPAAPAADEELARRPGSDRPIEPAPEKETPEKETPEKETPERVEAQDAETARPALEILELPFGPAHRPACSTALDGLDPDQRAAAEVVAGPLLIVAGPGTGKTRTLTHRIAHLVSAGVAPERCLALTFTRRAAEEMRERLAELLGDTAAELTVATFHGFGLSILRQQHAEVGLHRGFRIADEAERLELARELFGLSARRTSRLLAEMARLQRDATADGTHGAGADRGGADHRGADHRGADHRSADHGLEEQLAAYERALRDRDLVDFDSLLAAPCKLLGERDDLRDAYRARFPFISIDEYQDIDALQYRLVRLLAPADGHLCAIGDPDQSIYRFRGADVGFFLRFQRDYPTARTVQLGRNYRSSRVIVDAALSAIAPATLVADRRLEAVLEPSTEPVVVFEAASERAEAEEVVHTIERLLGGTSYFSVDSGRVAHGGGSELSFDDFAVLYRTDAQSDALIEALNRSGMPYQKRSHGRLLDRPEVRALLLALRQDRSGLSGGRRGSVFDRLTAEAGRVAAASDLRDPVGPDDAAPIPAAALRAAVDLVAPLAKRHGDDLGGFLAEITLAAEVDTWDPRAECVSLLTLHAAKGLEFPVVFIVGCEDGLLPHRFAVEEEGGIDEERRLFFVGMTRARARLYLSYARRRYWRGEVRAASPSPFLGDIDEGLLERRRNAERKRRPEGPKQLRLL